MDMLNWFTLLYEFTQLNKKSVRHLTLKMFSKASFDRPLIWYLIKKSDINVVHKYYDFKFIYLWARFMKLQLPEKAEKHQCHQVSQMGKSCILLCLLNSKCNQVREEIQKFPTSSWQVTYEIPRIKYHYHLI